MEVSHKFTQPCAKEAFDALVKFMEERARTGVPVDDVEAFERQAHTLFAAAEAELMGAELAKFDIDVPAVKVNGVVYRRVLRCADEYFAASGQVRVQRSLYASRETGGGTICPMELRAGIVEGRWTPLAARQATWVVAQSTPYEGEELFRMLGGMRPSRSTLDRLPKELNRRWEAHRPHFEELLREGELVPPQATTMAVSLDGVMVPLKDGERSAKRAQAKAVGKMPSGPAGFGEAGCGTVSFYDFRGERLSTIRWGRMPEKNKETLKAILTAEVNAFLNARPDLVLVKLGDGVNDNWDFLSNELPPGHEAVDFPHGVENLQKALVAAYGEGSVEAAGQLQKLRHHLRDDDRGVEKVIRALAYLRMKHPRRQKIANALRYFRRHRHRMRYARLRQLNLPIGTGVTEAACKTLATQRLRCSGMSWRDDGGQAILTFRSLAQSDRFDRGWRLLAGTYTAEVTPTEPRFRRVA